MSAGPTRAELLERCQALGLKATGWKKERMQAELDKLQPPVAPEPDWLEALAPADKLERFEGLEPEPTVGPAGWQAELELAEPAERATRRTPLCLAPLWARHHLGCHGRCSCACHEPGWERPAMPEGAVPSKFDREAREALELPWVPVPENCRLPGAL